MSERVHTCDDRDNNNGGNNNLSAGKLLPWPLHSRSYDDIVSMTEAKLFSRE